MTLPLPGSPHVSAEGRHEFWDNAFTLEELTALYRADVVLGNLQVDHRMDPTTRAAREQFLKVAQLIIESERDQRARQFVEVFLRYHAKRYEDKEWLKRLYDRLGQLLSL